MPLASASSAVEAAKAVRVWLPLAVAFLCETGPVAQEAVAQEYHPQALTSRLWSLSRPAAFGPLSTTSGRVVRKQTLLKEGSLGCGTPAVPSALAASSAAGSSPPTLHRRLYWSAALAVGAGALALWSKNEADDSYEHYLRSASQSRQKKQFDRAERYDRLSGGAFILMEAGIVLTTYYLFF